MVWSFVIYVFGEKSLHFYDLFEWKGVFRARAGI